MQLAKRTEQVTLLGSFLGIPAAILLEQFWVACAPLAVAYTLGTYNRYQLERNLLNQSTEQQQELLFQLDQAQKALKTVEYRLVYDRPGSREIFLNTLKGAEKFAIFVCPWVMEHSIDSEVKALLKQRLDSGLKIGIGYGKSDDIRNGKMEGNAFYDAVPILQDLKEIYPKLLDLKVIGTHEKFLVCDYRYAMLGSHNFLASGLARPEREVGIWTCDRNIVHDLVDRFVTS